jgi:alpha-beta hydrolase superfamily lysophospholipase
MEGWVIGIMLIFVLIVLGNLFTRIVQDLFIFRPERLPESFQFTFRHPWEEKWIKTPQGGRINALFFRQTQRARSRGVVVYFHGNAGSLKRWGHLYQPFVKEGYDFLICDYRGFGKSKGPRNEIILLEDAEAIYQEVAREYSPDDILLYGRSMGSAFATWVAAHFPCRLLILETPFSSMKRLFRAYFPFLPPVFLFKYRFPNWKLFPRVKVPIYIFHGDSDLVVPIKVADELRPFLKPGDQFFTIQGGSHNNLYYFDLYQVELARILNPDRPDLNPE